MEKQEPTRQMSLVREPGEHEKIKTTTGCRTFASQYHVVVLSYYIFSTPQLACV